MAKPSKGFTVPKNKDAEPALSSTLDPYDYESGSGKTYHDKHPKSHKNEGPTKPEPIAGIDESTETAGTTTLWKINAGDSPDPKPKKVKDSESEAEDEKSVKEPEEPKKSSKKSKKEDSEDKEEKSEKSEKKEEAAGDEKKEKKEKKEEDHEAESFA